MNALAGDLCPSCGNRKLDKDGACPDVDGCSFRPMATNPTEAAARAREIVRENAQHRRKSGRDPWAKADR